MTLLLIVTVLSIWFGDTAHLATFLGRLLFAPQKVIHGLDRPLRHPVILRGNRFTRAIASASATSAVIRAAKDVMSLEIVVALRMANSLGHANPAAVSAVVDETTRCR